MISLNQAFSQSKSANSFIRDPDKFWARKEKRAAKRIKDANKSRIRHLLSKYNIKADSASQAASLYGLKL